ncbi:MAG: hypothetical protein VYC27_04545 [Candidatus Thermoplasmatota archaeon]|nr:hypothetical protein [Candidatus Thermoplasmatota archaeon]MEE2666896.1 hypothetical protein [Candidatus Thermoplasmatota archaeon]
MSGHRTAPLTDAFRRLELGLSTLDGVLGSAEAFPVGNRDAVLADQGLTSLRRRTLPL